MPRPDPDERKQEIIAAAAAVFARKGFYGASMDDIVQASGLSKGGLYWHFDSKDTIVMAVLDQFFSQEFAEIEQLLAADLPPTQKLEQLLRQMMADTADQLAVYRNIWLEFYAVAAREGAFRERMLVYMTQFIDLVTQLIQQGVDKGDFRTVDPEQTAVAIAAQFEGLILLWAINPDAIDLKALAETAIMLIQQGLTNDYTG